MAGAGADVEMGAAGDTVPAADDHSIPPDSPPAGESQGASSPQKGADILGTSGAGELIIPPAVTREEELDAEDDATDYRFLQSMSTGFKDLQSRYGKRLERLQRRALNAEKAEQEFLQRADERVQDINERQAQLAADREAFILEKAKFEAAQAKAAEKAAAIDKDLVQRKAALDSHEKDLAAREQALATKLQAKDDKIQMLIAKRTQELEDSHKVAIQAQAEEHAGKLKEAVEAAGAAEAAKANLDAHVKELEEKLAASDKEISILKESAQKAAYSLGELQSSLSSKNKELQAAGNVNADLKLKLATLEGTLEVAKEKERLLMIDLEDEKKLLADAEQKFNQLKESLALWTSRLVNVAERLTVQLATMGMKSWSFTVNQQEATSVRLTLFFEGLIAVLDAHHKERAAKFAAESRKLLHDVLFKVLTKIVHRNPGINLSKVFTSLPAGTDTSEIEKLVAPIASRASEGAVRVQGQLRN